jgi:hypothetical protein
MPLSGPNKRPIFVLLVLACLVVAGTLFQTYRFDQQHARDLALEDTAAQQLHAAELALAEVRQAQAGYVAAGQGAAFWMNRFDEAIARVEGTLRERQQTTTSKGALAHYDAAIEQLTALRTSDKRARNYVSNGHLVLASDVIFVESLEILTRVRADVSAALDTEVFGSRQLMARNTQFRQALVVGGLLFTLLVAAIAFRKIRVVPMEEPAPALTVAPPAVAPAVAAVPVTSPMRLADTADVCVDMARLLDGRDLPALVERAAAAIGAKGLVLWVIDADKTSLRATLGHGYSDRMLQRLGTLPVSADNVTSVACRTLQPQVVPSASPDAAGAIAVPLIGPMGCVGVLAVEVKGLVAGDAHVATARVIGAQLSSVITPSGTVTSRAAAE